MSTPSTAPRDYLTHLQLAKLLHRVDCAVAARNAGSDLFHLLDSTEAWKELSDEQLVEYFLRADLLGRFAGTLSSPQRISVLESLAQSLGAAGFFVSLGKK